MKQFFKYILAGIAGFGLCFAILAVGLSKSFEVPFEGKVFTCFRSE